MDSDNVKRCDCQKIDAWSSSRHPGFVVEGGGRERRLWIVDGAPIEHRRLPTFALGMTSPQHN